MAAFIHQSPRWPRFTWDKDTVLPILVELRHRQGRLLGRMEGMGFALQAEAGLDTLTVDVVKTSEIEGVMLDREQVRSSVARQLGMDIAGLVPSDRDIDGVVEMMLDATQHYADPLDADRLFNWHASLFPSGRSGSQRMVVGAWRDNPADDPMQVVSGPMGRQRVHFVAPDSDRLEPEMSRFFDWFNTDRTTDPVLKAAIAHLWFVTIHPFDDGNGRMARAIADLQLCRADQSPRRFYSMSAQIRQERKTYYEILENTQRGDLDITDWLSWFLSCLGRAIDASAGTLDNVWRKARFWETHRTEALNERQQLMLNKLLDGFEGKLTSSKWALITKTSQDSALRDIQDLVQKGILAVAPGGGRSSSYTIVG